MNSESALNKAGNRYALLKITGDSREASAKIDGVTIAISRHVKQNTESGATENEGFWFREGLDYVDGRPLPGMLALLDSDLKLMSVSVHEKSQLKNVHIAGNQPEEQAMKKHIQAHIHERILDLLSLINV
jgi:hypothetical protein